jgi:hypothetical protein
MKRWGVGVALWAALVLPGRVGADGLPQADARLERPVTLSGERVYLGELLDRIRAQAGVPVSVDDRREAVSGLPLTVHLEARPAREVLSGLQELLSHRFLNWSWETGQDGEYVLTPSAAPAEAARQARKAAAVRFHGDLRELYVLARGDAGAREAKARERATLFPGHMVDARRVALLQSIPSEGIEALVKGEEVVLPGPRLSAEARQALRLGITSPLPEPAEGLLQIRWQDDPPGPRKFRTRLRGLGPVLYLRTVDMATNFLGGTLWDQEWLP